MLYMASLSIFADPIDLLLKYLNILINIICINTLKSIIYKIPSFLTLLDIFIRRIIMVISLFFKYLHDYLWKLAKKTINLVENNCFLVLCIMD